MGKKLCYVCKKDDFQHKSLIRQSHEYCVCICVYMCTYVINLTQNTKLTQGLFIL